VVKNRFENLAVPNQVGGVKDALRDVASGWQSALLAPALVMPPNRCAIDVLRSKDEPVTPTEFSSLRWHLRLAFPPLPNY